MNDIEKQEALEEIVSHHGFPVLLEKIDAIIDLIKGSILSVTLDKDPEKAALALYAERMKLEGVLQFRNALNTNVRAIKEKRSAR